MKARKWSSRFLQRSLVQLLTTRTEIDELFKVLTEEEIDVLVQENIFFSRTCSPAATMELSNVPACKVMRIITYDSDYHMYFNPEEVVGIFLHEIGHVLNPEIKNLEGEFVADNFAKLKGYKGAIISGLKKGLNNGWIGFEKRDVDSRIENLNAI